MRHDRSLTACWWILTVARSGLPYDGPEDMARAHGVNRRLARYWWPRLERWGALRRVPGGARVGRLPPGWGRHLPIYADAGNGSNEALDAEWVECARTIAPFRDQHLAREMLVTTRAAHYRICRWVREGRAWPDVKYRHWRVSMTTEWAV